MEHQGVEKVVLLEGAQQSWRGLLRLTIAPVSMEGIDVRCHK